VGYCFQRHLLSQTTTSKNWAIEGWYGRSNTNAELDSSKILAERASIAALRYLKTDSQTRPFISLGASREEFDPEIASSFGDNTLDLGLGFKHYFENNFILRGDVIARGFNDLDDDIQIDKLMRLSIGFTFGNPGKPAAKAEAKPATIAPPKQVQTAKVDTDGDGVYDDMDKCPTTPQGLKVDTDGCKLVLTETVSIQLNIQFPNNSDAISESYMGEIKNVADFMSQYSGTVVEVQGHTDDRGAASYNQQLSQKRANAVAAKLVDEFGVASNRVTAKGFGEERPIADNSTAEGRAENRRVIAEISTEIEKEITKEE